MYLVSIDAQSEKFDNLNQVYGFLCGRVTAYRSHRPTFRQFKAWWLARRRRQAAAEPFAVGGVTCRILSTRK